jgi:hypothetical protein
MTAEPMTTNEPTPLRADETSPAMTSTGKVTIHVTIDIEVDTDVETEWTVEAWNAMSDAERSDARVSLWETFAQQDNGGIWVVTDGAEGI